MVQGVTSVLFQHAGSHNSSSTICTSTYCDSHKGISKQQYGRCCLLAAVAHLVGSSVTCSGGLPGQQVPGQQVPGQQVPGRDYCLYR
jgi:hypothetical protein